MVKEEKLKEKLVKWKKTNKQKKQPSDFGLNY